MRHVPGSSPPIWFAGEIYRDFDVLVHSVRGRGLVNDQLAFVLRYPGEFCAMRR